MKHSIVVLVVSISLSVACVLIAMDLRNLKVSHQELKNNLIDTQLLLIQTRKDLEQTLRFVIELEEIRERNRNSL